ncbi:MAG: aldo/keto reductase [Candidatus Freyarchaeum deiterrae]
MGKTGEKISILGQGTWGLNRGNYELFKDSLRKGIELGMTHIDTAEVYAWGVAERAVGEVVSEYNRDDLFITSKLFPMHVTDGRSKKACYSSLKRLGLKNVDLYLVHWPIPSTMKRMMRVMEALVKEGKTRYIGVSNYSVAQFKKAQSYLKKYELVDNQLKAHLEHQVHINESLPFYQKEGVTMTAYSPLAHSGFTKLGGKLGENLEKVAKSHKATIQQIAIAWLINHDNVIAIPKAFKVKHVESNAEAADIKLKKEDIELLSTK